jgi:hypothetical protein
MTMGLKARRLAFFNGCAAQVTGVSMTCLLNELKASCGRASLGAMPIAQFPEHQPAIALRFRFLRQSIEIGLGHPT